MDSGAILKIICHWKNDENLGKIGNMVNRGRIMVSNELACGCFDYEIEHMNKAIKQFFVLSHVTHPVLTTTVIYLLCEFVY